MAGPVHEWDDCRFEPAEYRLTREGQPVALPGKTLDLLALLVARAPNLVPKATILQDVWPDAIVEEGNVAFHVAALRKALQRDGAPTCIETVRGRGYRFAAQVASTAPADEPPSADPSIAAAAPQRRWLPWTAAAAVLLAIAATAALAASLRPRDQVIVLPFEMPAGDLQKLNVSLVGFVTNALERRGIGVVPRDGGPDSETARAAGTRLGAWALITGTMTPAGSRWRVAVRLVRVSDGVTIWQWAFVSPPSDDRQETQSYISDLVARGLSQYLRARPD